MEQSLTGTEMTTDGLLSAAAAGDAGPAEPVIADALTPVEQSQELDPIGKALPTDDDDGGPSMEELLAQVQTLTKERNDYKAQSVGQRKNAERDQKIDEIASISLGTAKSIQAVIKHLSGESTAYELAASFEESEMESAQAMATQTFQQQAEDLSAELHDVLFNNDGTPKINSGNPVFQEAAQIWEKAKQEENVLLLERAGRMVFKAALDAPLVVETPEVEEGEQKPVISNSRRMATAAPRGAASGADESWRDLDPTAKIALGMKNSQD